jgi:hypothetical protein
MVHTKASNAESNSLDSSSSVQQNSEKLHSPYTPLGIHGSSLSVTPTNCTSCSQPYIVHFHAYFRLTMPTVKKQILKYITSTALTATLALPYAVKKAVD